jgi:hypothetical protein
MQAEQTDQLGLDAEADEALETARKLPWSCLYRSNEEGPAASARGRREAGAAGRSCIFHRSAMPQIGEAATGAGPEKDEAGPLK